MLSDNINLDCFSADVEPFRRVETGGGEFERQPKGSIALLEEWLTQRYSGVEAATVTSITDLLRKVRQLRQKPAHTVRKDRYGKEFYEMQDTLVWEAYRALNTLRRLLMEDGATSGYHPPSWDGRLTVKSY